MVNGDVPTFLLDQGFPKPPFEIKGWDRKAQYVHLSDFDRSLSTASTPDWMVILAAEAGSFNGFVSRDRSQLDEPETMIAVEWTQLSVVTWKKGIDDTIREWGMLLAYMPLVLKRIEQVGPSIFMLPNPRLGPENVQKKADAASRVAQNRKLAYRAMRAEAVELMRTHLRMVSRLDLADLLDRPPPAIKRSRARPQTPAAEPPEAPPLLDM